MNPEVCSSIEILRWLTNPFIQLCQIIEDIENMERERDKKEYGISMGNLNYMGENLDRGAVG